MILNLSSKLSTENSRDDVVVVVYKKRSSIIGDSFDNFVLMEVMKIFTLHLDTLDRHGNFTKHRI